MIDHQAFLDHAKTLIFGSNPPEVELRRAVSGLYYSLFHRLCAAGAVAFSEGGSALQQQAARAFNHSAMRKVCETYSRASRTAFPPPLDRLAASPPSSDLLAVCEQFIRLQEARHEADYDISATLALDEAIELWEAAEIAHSHWAMIEHLQETRVFLTALLLSDRWTRRG